MTRMPRSLLSDATHDQLAQLDRRPAPRGSPYQCGTAAGAGRGRGDRCPGLCRRNAHPARFATVIHGLFGLAVVLLVPWKTVIVRRARTLRVASLALVVLIAVCIAAGLVEVFGGYGVIWRLSPMQVHVGSAAVAAPLFAWHMLRHRRQRLRRLDLSRRTLLRTGALAAGVAATYATLEGLGRLAGAASASRIATGSHYVPADAIPATIWLFDQVPAHRADHRVHVAGTELTVADLASRSTTVAARLDCTSGWYTDAEWTAVSLADLLPPEQLAAAASIEVVSMTGYRRRFQPTRPALCGWQPAIRVSRCDLHMVRRCGSSRHTGEDSGG